MIGEAADRGAELTAHLLAFARKQPLQPRETDINALMLDPRRAVRPIARRADRDRDASREPMPGRRWSIPTQLTTALLNLAINARDAMPKGGKLTFETGNIVLDAGYARRDHEIATRAAM